MSGLGLLKRLLFAVVVAGLLLPMTARAALSLNCAFATQKVVFNEFYTGSGSFVEIYFLQPTTIAGWGIFIAPSNSSVNLVASLGTGTGTAYVPNGAGGYTQVAERKRRDLSDRHLHHLPDCFAQLPGRSTPRHHQQPRRPGGQRQHHRRLLLLQFVKPEHLLQYLQRLRYRPDQPYHQPTGDCPLARRNRRLGRFRQSDQKPGRKQ
jgi:hypothetical protein